MSSNCDHSSLNLRARLAERIYQYLLFESQSNFTESNRESLSIITECFQKAFNLDESNNSKLTPSDELLRIFAKHTDTDELIEHLDNQGEKRECVLEDEEMNHDDEDEAVKERDYDLPLSSQSPEPHQEFFETEGIEILDDLILSGPKRRNPDIRETLERIQPSLIENEDEDHEQQAMSQNSNLKNDKCTSEYLSQEQLGQENQIKKHVAQRPEAQPIKPGIGDNIKSFEDLLEKRLKENEESTLNSEESKSDNRINKFNEGSMSQQRSFLKKGEGLKRFTAFKTPSQKLNGIMNRQPYGSAICPQRTALNTVNQNNQERFVTPQNHFTAPSVINKSKSVLIDSKICNMSTPGNTVSSNQKCARKLLILSKPPPIVLHDPNKPVSRRETFVKYKSDKDSSLVQNASMQRSIIMKIRESTNTKFTSSHDFSKNSHMGTDSSTITMNTGAKSLDNSFAPSNALNNVNKNIREDKPNPLSLAPNLSTKSQTQQKHQTPFLHKHPLLSLHNQRKVDQAPKQMDERVKLEEKMKLVKSLEQQLEEQLEEQRKLQQKIDEERREERRKLQQLDEERKKEQLRLKQQLEEQQLKFQKQLEGQRQKEEQRLQKLLEEKEKEKELQMKIEEQRRDEKTKLQESIHEQKLIEHETDREKDREPQKQKKSMKSLKIAKDSEKKSNISLIVSAVNSNPGGKDEFLVSTQHNSNNDDDQESEEMQPRRYNLRGTSKARQQKTSDDENKVAKTKEVSKPKRAKKKKATTIIECHLPNSTY